MKRERFALGELRKLLVELPSWAPTEEGRKSYALDIVAGLFFADDPDMREQLAKLAALIRDGKRAHVRRAPRRRQRRPRNVVDLLTHVEGLALDGRALPRLKRVRAGEVTELATWRRERNR